MSSQELMKRGADRNVVDKKGRTALDYALKHGEESEVVQLLQSELVAVSHRGPTKQLICL